MRRKTTGFREFSLNVFQFPVRFVVYLQKMILEQELFRIFGFRNFRPGQRQVVEAIISGQDVVGIFPTGAGKSLCFQLSGLMRGQLTLVISPLISLMKDQVAHLEKLDIPATYFGAHLSVAEKEVRMSGLRAGAYRFLYISPERLDDPQILDIITPQLQLLVIDEAHCVSLWGKSFRPSYLALRKWIEELETVFTANGKTRPPIVAFSATATEAVLRDIHHFLKLKNPATFQKSVIRPNLYYSVCGTLHQRAQLLAVDAWITQHAGQSGIVYGGTRERVQMWAHYLLSRWPECGVAPYHAGLPGAERLALQHEFIQDTKRLLVATSAFGMGVDKPNVRWVLHIAPPDDLEGYIQEAGRAGRDGNVAACGIIFTLQQWRQKLEMHSQQFPHPQLVSAVFIRIGDFTRHTSQRAISFSELNEKFQRRIPQKQLEHILRRLESGALIQRKGEWIRISTIFTTQPDIFFKHYRQTYQAQREKIQSIEDYLFSKTCRTKKYSEYFGETRTENTCTTCDICCPELRSLYRQRASAPQANPLLPRFSFC